MKVEHPTSVVNEQGVHARPSVLIVHLAEEFEADIVIRNDDTGVEADAKSALEVMMLNAPRGTALTVTANGEDAQAAVEAMTKLIEAGFNEDDK